MINLKERCEQRKKEAQMLADKFNANKEEINKLKNEVAQKEQQNSQVYEEFKVKNSQYAELLSLTKEEENTKTKKQIKN